MGGRGFTISRGPGVNRQVIRKSHQRRHVSSVHLSDHDLLLGGRHAANIENLRPTGARAHDSWQCHRTMLCLPSAVELLLQDGRSVEEMAVSGRQTLECSTVQQEDVDNVHCPRLGRSLKKHTRWAWSKERHRAAKWRHLR